MNLNTIKSACLDFNAAEHRIGAFLAARGLVSWFAQLHGDTVTWTHEECRITTRTVLLVPPVTAPVPISVDCPCCGVLHVDKGEWAARPHKTHRCEWCDHEWRPFDYPTVGVAPRPDDYKED